MKKIAIFVLGLVWALSLCACACSNKTPATEPHTTDPTHTPTTSDTMPTDTVTIPVPETNIPDPSTNTELPTTDILPDGSSVPGTNDASAPDSRMMR